MEPLCKYRLRNQKKNDFSSPLNKNRKEKRQIFLDIATFVLMLIESQKKNLILSL